MNRADRVAIAAAATYAVLLGAKAGLAALAVARRRARLRAATGAPIATAELTIVQPIRSGDPQLERTLAATLEACPDARVLWLVDEDDPEGRRAADAARARHPLADVAVVDCPPCPPDAGPKMAKLAHAEPLLRTEVFAVVDDDTRLTPDGVAALLDGLRIAEVSTGLPCYAPGPGGWSRLVAQFVNDQAILTYLATSAAGPARALNGMAWAMRRATLDRLGGFAPLVPLLADDLAVAERVRAAGGAIDQTEAPQFVSTTVPDALAYRALMHRWMVFATLALRAEPVGWRAALVAAYALPPALLATAAGVAVARPTRPNVGAALAAVLVRSAVIAGVQRALTGRVRHDPVRSLAADLALPLQFAGALADRRITWRGRRYLVHANDRFEAVRP
ncbi:glycosyltransferase [Agromyces aurantiacus]|uniref:Glycosyltransferase n=1 Tax=Agromyces aurantiacus TaxID=165814 RepID=A0ABV9R139_9MICO|nr:glycosyltransferase [Agromyces aurantiacus]MBM7505632.1 ceramide glucosyltransferase [Agromyces aurantiacus]